MLKKLNTVSRCEIGMPNKDYNQRAALRIFAITMAITKLPIDYDFEIFADFRCQLQ